MKIIVVATITYLVGWIMAHNEVARECERQGSFYVGRVTFTCKAQP